MPPPQVAAGDNLGAIRGSHRPTWLQRNGQGGLTQGRWPGRLPQAFALITTRSHLLMAKVLRALSSKRPLRRGEERALALLHHMRSLRQEWESKNSAQSSANNAQQEIKLLEQNLKHLQINGPIYKTTFWKALFKSRSHLLAIGAAATLGIGIAANSNQSTRSAAPVFYILCLSGGIAAIARTNSCVYKHNSIFKQHNQKISSIKEQLGKARNKYEAYALQIKESSADFPSITLGSALLPLCSKSIIGRNLILAPKGLVKPSRLKTIALRDLSGDAERILDITRTIEDIPVLLKPDDESLAKSRHFSHSLHGEERQLKNAVCSYVATLGSIPDEYLTIHAIKPSSKLGRAVADVLSNNECACKDADGTEIVTIVQPESQQIDSQITRFENLQRETESISSAAVSQLDLLNSELKRLCQRYNLARSTSINSLHTNYCRTLNRANWCSKNYYCPRTILSKSYLVALIGLNFDRAHVLDKDELTRCLHKDSFISSRLVGNPHIIDGLMRSHEAIAEIMLSYQLVPDGNGAVTTGNTADYIIDQYNQELSLFRQRLIEALTGSPNGFLGISESARLYYDPVKEVWSSPFLPYIYTNAEIEQYGQVFRTDVDLLIPLWEHLWTEKADFRKSELFRTNESIQRMSEKEGEKIKQIGYQFQADLREVRSNMYVAKADFDAKLQELEEYEEGMRELGLLDSSQLARIQSATSQLEALRRDSFGDASGYEQILMLEPKNQLLRRQSRVHDPFDVIKSPDLLIKSELEKGICRLIRTDEEEAIA
jgi:hypothetical protein